ncbi:hypothetical protein [Lichenicoccus sp.]|uniref:hypothetical protein n=1 Tax=Lichenicoccus sp. TaxID=2781899 RepID=UPI003D0BCBB3
MPVVGPGGVAATIGLLAVGLLLCNGAVAASPRLPVRLSDQHGSSRIVVRLPSADAFALTQEDGHVVLHVIGVTLPRLPRGTAHGVSRVAIAGSFLRFDVGRTSRVRTVHDGRDLVLEVEPQDSPTAQPAPACPDQAGVLPGLPVPLMAVIEGDSAGSARFRSSVPDGAALPAPIASSAGGPTPPVAQPGSIGPVTLLASMADAPEGSAKGRGLLLPFEEGVGAAAFTRGSDTLVIFDAARPLDLSEVRQEPLAASASIQLLPEATMLTLPGRNARQFALQRVAAGWLILDAGGGQSRTAIEPVLDNMSLLLPVVAPGRTVIVPDPDTGENLLVGTLRTGTEAFDRSRHGHAYVIVESSLGIVIDPLSDRIEMRPTRSAFLLSGLGPQALGLPVDGQDARARADGSGARILALRRGTRQALYRRSKEAVAAAAAAPAGSRFDERMMAAQAALALGDGTQASTLAKVAVADDARQTCLRLTRIVRLAAAVLERKAAGSAPEPASDQDTCPNDPGYIDSPEVALWHGIGLARQDPGRPDAARLIASNLGLLQRYPEPLAAILLPIAAEALVEGGTDAQAGLIDAMPPGPKLTFARALLAARRGHAQPARSALDALRSDADIRIADLAAEQSVAMRLRSGDLTPRAAADSLDKHLLDARIAGHELSARYRLSELRIQAGQLPEALSLLRETSLLFPTQQDATRARAGDVLKRLAASPADGSAADTFNEAALIEANMDLVPRGGDGERLSRYLVDRLSALDLPERAAPIVGKLMAVAQSGLEKATLGARLAGLELQQNDPQAAQQALHDSDATDLPPALLEQRRMLRARGLTAQGHAVEALATIKDLTSSAALDLKANLLMARASWSDAAEALSTLVDRSVPATGPLDRSQQDLLLRLASAASRAGDAKRQAQVHDAVQGRIADGDKAALFQLLTTGATATGAAAEKADVAALRQVAAGVRSLGQ